MAEDIAPELLKKIQEAFRENCSTNKDIQEISQKVADGTAGFRDLEDYAIAAGDMLAKAMHDNVSGDILPDGKMYYNIASRILPPNLEECHEMVAEIAEGIYGILNEQAGLHIKAQRPDLNRDRIDGLVNYVSNVDQYEDVRKSTEQDVVNFSQSVATDAVHKNADFQYKAGLTPKIRREAESGCCEWCQSLEGTYDYGDVRNTGNDVWRRHRACKCKVTYDPGTVKVQDARSKEWSWKEENRAKVEERITFDRSREQEERNRKIHYGESREFSTDRGTISAKAVDSMGYNKIYVDEKVSISPRELREIDRSVSKAKEIHGIAYECDASILITDAGDTLASYNPRTNTIVVNKMMGNLDVALEKQRGFAAEDDPNSTMVHELFHWKDADEYKRMIGEIKDVNGEYTPYIRSLCEERLINEGIDLSDDSAIMKISRYAYEKLIKDNDTEEVYTEYRTLKLLGDL